MEAESDGECEDPVIKPKTLFDYGISVLSQDLKEELIQKKIASLKDKPVITPKKQKTNSTISSTSSSKSKSRVSVTLFPPRELQNSRKKSNGRGSEYVNWWDKETFPVILKAMRDYKKVFLALKYLKGEKFRGVNGVNPFTKLSRTTLSNWFEKSTGRLKPEFEKYVARGSCYGFQSLGPIYENEALMEELQTTIRRLREDGLQHFCIYMRIIINYYLSFTYSYLSGNVITTVLVQAIFSGKIKQFDPGRLRSDNLISLTWTRKFLKNRCDMTFRKATTTLDKLPIDWRLQQQNMVSRVAWFMFNNGTLPELVVNSDQTRIHLVPNAGTYYLPNLIILIKIPRNHLLLLN
jgi:hypothetical protein